MSKQNLRIGIYDRYLSTAGGGERYSCKMAEILSKQPGFTVELISDLYSDISAVSSRLNIDLSRVSLKVFPFLSNEYAGRITGAYDIFINATYLSSLCGYAKRNLYLCYFPTPFNVDFGFLHRFLLIFFRPAAVFLHRLADRLISRCSDIEVIEGIYDLKKFILRRGSWTSGKVLINYTNTGKPVMLGLKNPASSGIEVLQCNLKLTEKATGKKVFKQSYSLKKGIREHALISIPRTKDKYILEILSDTFIPQDSGVSGNADTRILGPVIYNEDKISFARKTLLKILGFVPLFLVTYPRDLKFLDTYNEIIAISGYSSKWIKRFWKKKSTLLFPPVDVEKFTPLKKEKIIVSVGRFFPEHHNKKQLEMAKAFIELYDSGADLIKDFKLVLIGGVENKKEHMQYVEKIKELCRGYPVEVLTNISWERLSGILSKALVFWHASGMGEDEEKNPEKFEHFGITTVEAMASGAICVVINKGGQPEIIDDKVNGFLFESWGQLKEHTLKICSGELDNEAISRRAIERAGKFSSSSFERNLLEIIKKHTRIEDGG